MHLHPLFYSAQLAAARLYAGEENRQYETASERPLPPVPPRDMVDLVARYTPALREYMAALDPEENPETAALCLGVAEELNGLLNINFCWDIVAPETRA